jgi:hypothetical protein
MSPAQPCFIGIADESGVWLSLAAQLDVDIKIAMVAVLNNFNLVIYLSSGKYIFENQTVEIQDNLLWSYMMKIRSVSNSA